MAPNCLRAEGPRTKDGKTKTGFTLAVTLGVYGGGCLSERRLCFASTLSVAVSVHRNGRKTENGLTHAATLRVDVARIPSYTLVVAVSVNRLNSELRTQNYES